MKAGVLGMVMVMVSLSDGKVMVCSERNVTVTKLSKVSILCPPAIANSSETKYSLLFNGSSISDIHQKISDSGGLLFSGHFEVTANNSGLYICQMTVIYPPPSTEHCHTTEVLVQEKRSLPPVNDTVPEAVQICPVSSPFVPEVVMRVGCGVLLVYSLLITSIAIVKERKRKLKKDEEDANVYINTRPVQLRTPSKV